MSDTTIAKEVLDYWFAIEFLGQDSIEDCTEATRLSRELRKYRRASLAEKRKSAYLTVFEKINESTDIRAKILEQAEACGMTEWSNLTFYIGKVKRQDCIEVLAKCLGSNLQQAEADDEEIPVLSFQCTNNGVYVEHSLSLSTILWTLSQVENNAGSHLPELFSYWAYTKAVEDWEKVFFPQDAPEDEAETRNSPELADQRAENTAAEGLGGEEGALSDQIPVFEITAAQIRIIYEELLSTYGRFIGSGTIEPIFGMKYQLFRDKAAKDRYEDDNYMGLSHDFFSNDIKMVRDAIVEKKYDFNSGMLSDLIAYICAPHDVQSQRERYDFVAPKQKGEFLEELSEILNIRNAPLGKWPSRYRPALMQQVAINLAISEKANGIAGKKGHVFSVNGPPGTGKTTLLKELVASQVVKKAILLSKYTHPNDAFEGISFVHGPLNGAYCKYTPQWFRFKDDQITDYGMLVTSSNNTAVDNITKELPLEKGVVDGLQPKTGGEHPDGPEMWGRLAEARKLFSVKETEKTLVVRQEDTAQREEVPEIFFTNYAQKLLGSEKKAADAWGLIAASLGKRKKIKEFYDNVLSPVLGTHLLDNDYLTERYPQYQSARKAFLARLEKVQKLREELGQYGDVAINAYQSSLLCKETTERNNKKIAELQALIASNRAEAVCIQKQEQERKRDLREKEALCAEINHSLQKNEQQRDELMDQKASFLRQAAEAEGSVTLLTKLFRRQKYLDTRALAQTLRDRASNCDSGICDAARLIDSDRKRIQEVSREKASAERQLWDIQTRAAAQQRKEAEWNAIIRKLNHETVGAKEAADAAAANRERLLQKYRSAGELKAGLVLDESFVEEILSPDSAASTEAQTANPWSTEEFNLEREKLFYDALQMTKEFLLSSKYCRQNLRILGQYWGLKIEDNKKIRFHPEDSEAMLSSLLNTLFLLTPVVSSTFASVGRMLKDLKTPGSIGTLIIDEAGQAQPQMAVGALFRARNGVIVGDPKQIEPVIKDDLDLLKKAYSSPALNNYKDKSISVQMCADLINPFGAFFDNGTDYPEWVGCPLLVHRRCIAPMYEISNQISYNGIMKQKTQLPSAETAETFLRQESQWMNVGGKEYGQGNHYVPEQGRLVCEMVAEAFAKAPEPKLFIISPFNSVIQELKKALSRYREAHWDSALARSNGFENWLKNNLGTVHTFQGKEANEVILLLGCDESAKTGYAVTGFVNSNLVNVAATRAKYRLYIVGDFHVWKNNPFLSKAKAIMDTQPMLNPN